MAHHSFFLGVLLFFSTKVTPRSTSVFVFVLSLPAQHPYTHPLKDLNSGPTTESIRVLQTKAEMPSLQSPFKTDAFIFCCIFVSVIHTLPSPWGFNWLTWLLAHSSPHWEVKALKANSWFHWAWNRAGIPQWTEFNLDHFYMVPAAPRPRTYMVVQVWEALLHP